MTVLAIKDIVPQRMQNVTNRQQPEVNFLWLLCPAHTLPNCWILKIWHRIIGDPVSWEPSAGLGHVEDTQLRKSGNSTQNHNHKINEHPQKVNLFFMKYQLSLINRSSGLSFAMLLGCGSYLPLSDSLGCGYHMDTPTYLTLLHHKDIWELISKMMSRKPLGWSILELWN